MLKRFTITIFLVFTLVPMLAGIIYSVLYSLGMAGLLGKGFTLEHWSKLFANNETWYSLGYTTLLTLASLALTLLLALPLAYALTFKYESKRLYASLFLPLTVPPLIAGFAWYQILSPSGIFSRAANGLGMTEGVEGFPRLVNDFASIGVLVTHVFLLFPFFALVFVNIAEKENLIGLQGMSATLGASKRQFFFRVFTPLMLKRATSLLLLYGVFLFGTYEVPLLLGRSSPRAVTILIVEKVSKYDLSGIPVGHAMAVLYSVMVGLLVTAFIWRKNAEARA
jgi:putative spermidine/putrescine transport system permease protein